MYQKIKAQIDREGYSTIQDFNEDFNKMVISYLNNTKEPENYKMLENFLSTNVFDDMDYIMQIQTDKMIAANKEFENKVIADEERIEHLTQMLNQEKHKNKEKEEELRHKSKNVRTDLENELMVMKAQLQNKEDQFLNLETMMKKGWENNERTVKEIKSKQLENLKLELSLENEKKINAIKEDNRKKLEYTKKEMKKIFEATLKKMSAPYEDEIQMLKKTVKEQSDRITLLKKMCVRKDGEINMLNERLRGNEAEEKLKMDHAELVLQLANALKEGSTKGSETSKESVTRY